ncbi:Yip1 family protein [Asticcacaulis tiandongensis]|uniref:Yip1 family protein n=1 Tax=Asticcacaulis tiandongensis TaxID=2565365 RepID=UPI0015E85F20|nr:Yip1 family protein [Asticcacaulis tiandongensis]
MTVENDRIDTGNLVSRVKGILLQPSLEWDRIRLEPSSKASITTGYVLILAAIPAIAGFIGMSLIGVSLLGITTKTPLIAALIQAILTYVLSVAGVFILGFIINALSPSFDGKKDDLAAFKVAAYSSTAAWLAGIFAIIPMLAVLGILGLYSLYLLYKGLPKLMESPPEKSMGFTAVVVIIAIVVHLVIWAIVGAVSAVGLMGAGMAGGLANQAGNSITLNTSEGKVTLNNLEEAQKKMEAAAKAVEDGTYQAIAADQLEALLPANFNGVAASNARTSSGGAGGYMTSLAEAEYTLNDGHVTLKLTDIGAMGAVAGMVQMESSEKDENGYRKVSAQNGRMITESYDNPSQSGSYAVLIGSRVLIEADGSGVPMDTLKKAVNSVDASKVEALTK